MPPTRRLPPALASAAPPRVVRGSPSDAASVPAALTTSNAPADVPPAGDDRFSGAGSAAPGFGSAIDAVPLTGSDRAAATANVPGLARQGQINPVEADLYAPILQAAQGADWQGCGIDPLRYVEDRLDRDGVLQPLLLDDRTKIVLHRRALTAGQAPGLDPQNAELVSGKGARDYPGRVYRSLDNDTLHVVGIPGEDWFVQTLHMLAVAGVRSEKIQVEGTPDVAGLASRDLDETLTAHQFDGVVVGTLGALTQAVERSLRLEMQPIHEQKCLENMRTHLQERVANARPDKKDRWEQRAQRLDTICAAPGENATKLLAIAEDPELRSCLAEHLRAVKDGAPSAELPMRTKNGKAKVFSHRILETGGKKHLLLHIGGAHGDLAHAAVRRVLEKQSELKRVAFYGTCGSFHGDRLPPDTFVKPSGKIASTGAGRKAVQIENHADLPGAVPVRHTNVSTLLEEHQQGLKKLEEMGETVDIEGYHVARAVSEFVEKGRDIDFRMLLRVSDVANDASLGAHRDDRAGTSDYDGRRDTEEEIAFALGLIEKQHVPNRTNASHADGVNLK